MVVQGRRYAVDMPGLWWVIAIVHLAFVVRLYVHAWAVDQATAFQEWRLASADLRRLIHVCAEWLIRGSWVVAVGYLPVMYAREMSSAPLFGAVGLLHYYFWLFLLVFIWDGMMYETVLHGSEFTAHSSIGVDRVSRLRWGWLVLDAALFLIISILQLAERDWGRLENWKLVVLSFLVGVFMMICLAQVLWWAKEIWASTIPAARARDA
ncbi:MAG TPA: hypothetical protein VGF28_11045 [Thermoanaerobaculia bacterium]|jgi:hypothetical protein